MRDTIVSVVAEFPTGVAPGQLEKTLNVSRATINRYLREAVVAGLIVPVGRGAARKYQSADPLQAIKRYFEKPQADRVFARYREDLLDREPSFDTSVISHIGKFAPMEKKDMIRFLIDFSCASSMLEGSTYSLLDTQALIEYGEKAEDKPLADAFLVLNHRNAFEYLYNNNSLDSIFKVHELLTDDHGLPELKEHPHFLGKKEQGVPREYNDVSIATTTYSPPFRPGNGYIAKMLAQVLDTSAKIVDPLQSAFYLLTRLPYLQPFADGNKRTSRVMCNVPLLAAGMPPISFADFGKKDYVLSMLAFYELGDIRMASQCFSKAYERSCERLGLKPVILKNEQANMSKHQQTVNEGRYSGKILDVANGVVTQKVGRGSEVVLHSLSRLSGPVTIGAVVDVVYSGGKGVVGSLERGVER